MDGQEIKVICLNWSNFKNVVNFFHQGISLRIFFCDTTCIEEHSIE